MEKISVIIPVYNEEKRLGNTLEKWQEFLAEQKPNYEILEIIIVDDGSTDKTLQIAESFINYLPTKTIKNANNLGKGNAVKTGVFVAQGDYIFIYDADAAVEPKELNKLFFYTNEANIIIGSRTIKGAKAKISFLRRIVGFCFHLYCLPLLGNIKDASCGAKLFKKDCAQKIFSLQKLNRFAFDIEILWLAKKLNYKIKEVGVDWKEIKGSKVKILKDAPEMFLKVLGLYKKAILYKIKK
jgi:dolichyl-phosphate beta-glucosyltransferase